MRYEFDSWMDRVDQELFALFGCVSLDLPDHDYWDCWDQGVSPRNMAVTVINDELDPILVVFWGYEDIV